jgi:hypothetical protein
MKALTLQQQCVVETLMVWSGIAAKAMDRYYGYQTIAEIDHCAHLVPYWRRSWLDVASPVKDECKEKLGMSIAKYL